MADVNFMDECYAATFQDKLLGRKLSPDSRHVMMNFRTVLKQAQRFVLSDEAVRLICHLSHERDRLPGWSFLARLPYNPMWIEFDLHTKVQEFEAMDALAHAFDPDQTSTKAGLLLYHDKGSESRWVCHVFRYLPDSRRGTEQPNSALIGYVFDPEGTGLSPVRGSTYWNSLTLSLRPEFSHLKVPVKIVKPITIPAGSPMTELENAIDNPPFVETFTNPEALACGMWHDEFSLADGMMAPEWFMTKAGVIPDPFWATWADRQGVIEGVATELQESKGELRWIITLLAAINALPRDVKPIKARVGRRPAGIRMLPYLDHHAITINLPRDNRVVRARKVMDGLARNAQRRLHQVIGHWRIVEFGKVQPGSCRHVPVMVENGLGICEVCELLVRWIPQHQRGSPEFGIIDHTYNVQAKKSGLKRGSDGTTSG